MNKSLKNLMVMTAGTVFALQSASATLAAITYSDRDMLLDFYKPGGTTDYEVDLGSVTQVTSLYGTGQTVSFSSKFSLSDINAALVSFNSVNFGIVAAQTSASGNYPANTLWVT